MKKIVVLALALMLTVGSMAYIFVALLDDSDSSSTAAPGSTVSSASTTSTTRVEFTGEGSVEFCNADARLNQELSRQAPTTPDPAALEAYFEKKVAAVRQLETLAPAEVKADIGTTIRAYEAFAPVLAAVSWDQSKVPPAQAAAIQTPEVTAAGQRLAQYTERVCKLLPQG